MSKVFDCVTPERTNSTFYSSPGLALVQLFWISYHMNCTTHPEAHSGGGLHPRSLIYHPEYGQTLERRQTPHTRRRQAPTSGHPIHASANKRMETIGSLHDLISGGHPGTFPLTDHPAAKEVWHETAPLAPAGHLPAHTLNQVFVYLAAQRLADPQKIQARRVGHLLQVGIHGHHIV